MRLSPFLSGLMVTLALGGRPGPAQPLDLTGVFQADDTLSRALTSTLAQLHTRGPEPVMHRRILSVRKTIDGIRWTGFPRGADPSDRRNLETRQSRLTIELWIPAELDLHDARGAWLFVNQGGAAGLVQPGPTLTLKRILARKLARAGILAAIWYEADQYPVRPGLPVGSVAHQLGYRGDGDLLHTALTWMIQKDPSVTPLDAQDLRYHYRFGLAQAYMLCTTFVQRYLVHHFGTEARAFARELKAVYGGGSKRGTAALTACGVDPRVRGARISGSQSGGDPSALGVWARYIKDWHECPGGRYGVTADFVSWSEAHADDAPSYYDVYALGRDPARYQHILFLDIVGTHDYVNPLGSHTSFWADRDGLVQGVRDPSEPRWKYRILRRPNCNHGADYVVGHHRGWDVTATRALVWRTMLHLRNGGGLPRVDLVDLDASGETWTMTVRVQGDHRPADESLGVWVALSDDRDFRRCSSPVISNPGGICHDGIEDDNREEEDRFIHIVPRSVERRGAYRILAFDRPAEWAAFDRIPLVAAFAELRVTGPHPDHLADDVWLHTRLAYANLELYPERACGE